MRSASGSRVDRRRDHRRSLPVRRRRLVLRPGFPPGRRSGGPDGVDGRAAGRVPQGDPGTQPGIDVRPDQHQRRGGQRPPGRRLLPAGRAYRAPVADALELRPHVLSDQRLLRAAHGRAGQRRLVRRPRLGRRRSDRRHLVPRSGVDAPAVLLVGRHLHPGHRRRERGAGADGRADRFRQALRRRARQALRPRAGPRLPGGMGDVHLLRELQSLPDALAVRARGRLASRFPQRLRRGLRLRARRPGSFPSPGAGKRASGAVSRDGPGNGRCRRCPFGRALPVRG